MTEFHAPGVLAKKEEGAKVNRGDDVTTGVGPTHVKELQSKMEQRKRPPLLSKGEAHMDVVLEAPSERAHRVVPVLVHALHRVVQLPQ